MKIYPINNIKYNLQAGVQPSLSPVNAEDVRNMTELSGIYMPVISFCGDYEEFKRQMLSLDNIHCPGCGNKMLSEKKLKQIVNNAAYTKTIPEYAKFLEKNKEYFHPQYQPFIAYVNRFAQNTPEKSIQDMLNVMSKGSSVLMNKQFVKDADYLQKQLERKQFSPSDKEKINECINYFRTLEKIPKYSDLKEHLLNTLGSLDSEQKWELYNKIKKNFQKIYTYNFVLKNRDINTAGLPEHAAVTYNILLNSKSSLASVYQNPAKEKRFNKFLLCDNCAASYKSFSAITSKPDAKEKLELYSNDIADAIAQRKLAGNNLYLYEFFRTVRGFTKNRISTQNKKRVVKRVFLLLFSNRRIRRRNRNRDCVGRGICGNFDCFDSFYLGWFNLLEHDFFAVCVFQRQTSIGQFIRFYRCHELEIILFRLHSVHWAHHHS